MIAFFTGGASTNSPCRVSTSSPPQSSWKSIVIEPQSVWAGIRADDWLSRTEAGTGG